MNLIDRLHCPDCRSRLTAIAANALRCTGCERTIAVIDRIPDLIGEHVPPPHDPPRNEADATNLLARVRDAAGHRWPAALGDVIEVGCGGGQFASAIAPRHIFRSMLVLDTAIDRLQSCRERVGESGLGTERPIFYARLGGNQDAIRDAVADTVMGAAALAGTDDVRRFLTAMHRVMKPNGRALFVVPNRRFRQAMCQAMAEALAQRFTRGCGWPEEREPILRLISHNRGLLVHGDAVSELAEKRLFDSEELEDLAGEAGFATAEMIPLDPDPAGVRTTGRLCQEAGATDRVAQGIASLAGVVGQPFFSLLSRQDSSASMLLWLTKGAGPAVRVFTARPAPAPVAYADPETALGGAPPRWSVELLGRDTPDGVMVTVGGWCLANTDVVCARLTLNDVVRHAPVWHARPDVHEVMNGHRLYRPLNALCSGLDSELLFDGVQPADNRCALRLEIILAGNLVATAPAPDTLTMDAPTVVAQ